MRMNVRFELELILVVGLKQDSLPFFPFPAAQQRKDEEVVALLQDYFSRIWYPNGDDKAALMEATGLSLSQLNAWFSHERKKAKKELERLDELTYTLERDLRQTCWNIMAAYRILGLPILEMRDNMVDGSVLTFEESNWLVQMADGYGKMMQMPPQQLIAQMHQWFAEKDELAEELEVAQKEWKELATAHDHGLREGRDDY